MWGLLPPSFPRSVAVILGAIVVSLPRARGFKEYSQAAAEAPFVLGSSPSILAQQGLPIPSCWREDMASAPLFELKRLKTRRPLSLLGGTLPPQPPPPPVSAPPGVRPA